MRRVLYRKKYLHVSSEFLEEYTSTILIKKKISTICKARELNSFFSSWQSLLLRAWKIDYCMKFEILCKAIYFAFLSQFSNHFFSLLMNFYVSTNSNITPNHHLNSLYVCCFWCLPYFSFSYIEARFLYILWIPFGHK